MNIKINDKDPENKKKKGRSFQGKVVGNKMNKTISVMVERKVKHPVLGKYLVRSKKYSVHNEIGEFNLGDVVAIRECKPVSKTKSWEVISSITKVNEV
ncbi:MAG: 30S ribosomal protein S17 [Betaproteobacteria bacterium TMED41]|nr:MAG: 30S ribosomal protein S17 [Betaproteobacteria bacterium TMED41]|tara:strand:- start:553 stop:846 length:294 start_codon:yes stop_codon:yes gene_type:complete